MSDYQKILERYRDLIKVLKETRRDMYIVKEENNNLEEQLEIYHKIIHNLEEKNKEYQIIIGTLLKGDEYGKKD